MLAVVALVTALAVPASAASDVTNRRGGFVIAVWDDAATGTFAVVEYAADVDYLIVYLVTEIRDEAGNLTGYRQQSVDANLLPYGSFTIDRALLSTATISASDVPSSACTFDPNFDNYDCTSGTIDLNASWTGIGEIDREPVLFKSREGGFLAVAHEAGPNRSAIAAGTIDGVTLAATEDASMAYTVYGFFSVDHATG